MTSELHPDTITKIVANPPAPGDDYGTVYIFERGDSPYFPSLRIYVTDRDGQKVLELAAALASVAASVAARVRPDPAALVAAVEAADAAEDGAVLDALETKLGLTEQGEREAMRYADDVRMAVTGTLARTEP